MPNIQYVVQGYNGYCKLWIVHDTATFHVTSRLQMLSEELF